VEAALNNDAARGKELAESGKYAPLKFDDALERDRKFASDYAWVTGEPMPDRSAPEPEAQRPARRPVSAEQPAAEKPQCPQAADVAGFLAGTRPEPPCPVLLHRTDGNALFYAAKVNLVYGDPESGKTLLILAGCTEALRAGRRVLIVDLDHNGVDLIVPLLLQLGAPADKLADDSLFRYYDAVDSAAEMLLLVEECRFWRPAVAVIDSVGELLPLLGADSNSADDFTRAHTSVLKPLAKAGAAVIGVDHLAKNPVSRAQGPTGTGAKRRALSGLSVRVVVRRQFSPGQGGTADLYVNKDRPGGVRKHCPPAREQHAGRFVIDPPDVDGVTAWRVLPPLSTEGAGLSDDQARYLDAAHEIVDDITAVAVAATVNGSDEPTRSMVDFAKERLDQLVADGELTVTNPGGGRGKKRTYALPETPAGESSAP
jgi:hypothetical protein